MRFLQIVKGMNVYYLLRMGIIIGNRKRAFRLFSKPEERNKDCHILTVDSYQVHCPSIHSRRTDNCQTCWRVGADSAEWVIWTDGAMEPSIAVLLFFG